MKVRFPTIVRATTILVLVTISGAMPAGHIQVTRITDDIIVIHPSEVENLEIIREVGGTITAVRTDSGVIVFDSFVSLKAAKTARELIHEHFPGEPIRYLINTHHHADHVRGNQYFNDACIIGHTNVEKYMKEDHERLLVKYCHYNEVIDSLTHLLQRTESSPVGDKEIIREDLAFWNEAKSFLESYEPTPPTVQVSGDTLLAVGGKTFEILFFGAAHTDNDLVVLDREDRLLVMGDLLCYRKCYVMGPQSKVKNWITLLDTLLDRQDEYDHVIPGHGGAVLDASALFEQRTYLKDVLDATREARTRGVTLEEARESITLGQYRTYMMYDRIGLDIESCWQQIEAAERQKDFPFL
jgi:cyclase